MIFKKQGGKIVRYADDDILKQKTGPLRSGEVPFRQISIGLGIPHLYQMHFYFPGLTARVTQNEGMLCSWRFPAPLVSS